MRSPQRKVAARSGPAGYRMRGQQGRLIDALGEAIVAGRFAPGTLLPREAVLMTEFGVSRTSVREALKVLSAKGLLETRQRVGTRVRAADLWNLFDADIIAWHQGRDGGAGMMRDLIELRQVIEPAAARLAAGRAAMADLARLERAVLAMQTATSDLGAYAAADVEFHMAVFAASGNALFARLAHLVADFLHLAFHVQQTALDDAENPIEADVERHRRTFEAINRGDGAAAAEHMLEVVLDGKRSFYRTMPQPAAPEPASSRKLAGGRTKPK